MAIVPAPTSSAPHFIDVIEVQTYAWCACGLSRNQPFCDGSHKGSDDLYRRGLVQGGVLRLQDFRPGADLRRHPLRRVSRAT